LKYRNGATIGHIEEGFIARLRRGDCFVFAGRVLEYLRTQDMTAYVQRATASKGAVPVWAGGKMPLSTEMADAVLELLAASRDAVDHAVCDEPEMMAALPMLQTQARLSKLPAPGSLLVECLDSREGHHVYVYPFAGRQVHLGLASLLAWRLARDVPNTFSLSVNDYGFELLSAEPVDLALLFAGRLFGEGDLLADVHASLNSSELAQRRFREIARVSGLIFTGYPGAPKSTRQLQASSGLFFEVFRQHDADNLLLAQAHDEVLSQELDVHRLRAALQRLARMPIERVELSSPSPFCLPLMVERLRERLSTEQLKDRLERMIKQAEAQLDSSAVTVSSRRRPRR
jgi:ATP-dependent Lhr-like helicase